MEKQPQPCPTCNQPLTFRRWSDRYAKSSPWQEALAICGNGCGKFGVRYFAGSPTCEPYQIRKVAKKTRRGSWKLTPEREIEIINAFGSVQAYLDNSLIGMPEQYKQ